MEPRIPNGSLCVFSLYRGGSRQGLIVLAQQTGIADPDSGGSYTVKRYRSEKKMDGDLWQHAKIVRESLNPAYKNIELSAQNEDELGIIAELIEVLPA